jgi:hypothetical protein
VVEVAPDPELIDASDNNHISLDFLTSATTATGLKADRPVGKRIDLHPTPEVLEKIRQKGIGYRGVLDLAPGEYTIRFVVRDGRTRRVGSVAAPLKVE